ncbi:MAG TPA: RidA family protein [Caulobacteraceae bacterium]|nr:RidA family protein [Caulobacteraceae bacterium]
MESPVRISSGSSFESLAGYSRAVVVKHPDHAEVFISGCTGFDYSTMTIDEDVAVQIRQCFVNIADALTQAGGRLTHLVRVRYYLPESGDWERVAPVLGELLADIRPAASCLICGLIDPRMKIEIEADARIPL